MTGLVLYYGSGSAPARRVQLYLEERKIEYTEKLLEFSKKQHKSEEFVKLNPRGQVPVLVDDDFVVRESLAILTYLEEKYPQDSLLPKDLKERSKIVQDIHDFNSNGTGSNFYRSFFSPQDKWDVEKMKGHYETFVKEVNYWDKKVEGKQFLASDSFTLLDAVALPSLLFFLRIGYQFEGQKNLKAYIDRLLKRKSVIASTPPHWKNSENKTWVQDFLKLAKKD